MGDSYKYLEVQKSKAKDRGELDAANWAFFSLEEKMKGINGIGALGNVTDPLDY